MKIISKEVSVAISNLINQSVKTGLYPERLKIGCVRPVYKKGKHNEYANYRPITLLSSVDKIVEKYICRQIQQFYHNNDVITKNQFGFQPGKGTIDLLAQFTDEINQHFNHKRHVLALFIDFSRAFDTAT